MCDEGYFIKCPHCGDLYSPKTKLANCELCGAHLPKSRYVCETSGKGTTVKVMGVENGVDPTRTEVKWSDELGGWEVKELDPNGTSPDEPGAKLDAGKVPLRRGALEYFPRALMEVAKVSEFGARKYTWKGWLSVPDGISRYGDAMARHAAYQAMDEHMDSDSGLLHAAHEAWNALARLELMLIELQESS